MLDLQNKTKHRRWTDMNMIWQGISCSAQENQGSKTGHEHWSKDWRYLPNSDDSLFSICGDKAGSACLQSDVFKSSPRISAQCLKASQNSAESSRKTSCGVVLCKAVKILCVLILIGWLRVTSSDAGSPGFRRVLLGMGIKRRNCLIHRNRTPLSLSITFIITDHCHVFLMLARCQTMISTCRPTFQPKIENCLGINKGIDKGQISRINNGTGINKILSIPIPSRYQSWMAEREPPSGPQTPAGEAGEADGSCAWCEHPTSPATGRTKAPCSSSSCSGGGPCLCYCTFRRKKEEEEERNEGRCFCVAQQSA